MPNYEFKAMDASGKNVTGTLEAASEDQVITRLKQEGLYPTSVKETKSATTKSTEARIENATKEEKALAALPTDPAKCPKMKLAEIMLFTRQLSILLDAGLPLIRSLKTLQRQAVTPSVKSVLNLCATSVESGATFSEALAQHPKSFDKLFLNMVRAGEAAGAMETILDRLAEFMEKAARITAKVKGAMIYPCIVLSIALIITFGLMIFIVPSFTGIFAGLLGKNAQMPWLTVQVIALSDLMQRGLGLCQGTFFEYFEGPIEIVGLCIILFFGFKFIVRTPAGRIGVDRLLFKMPLFGPIISKTAISRFSRTLGTLLGSGVAMLQALQIVKETAGNYMVATAVQKIHDAVKDGEGMAEPLSASGIFPQMVVAMVEVGEETGKLPEMLNKVAETYEEEVDNAVGALTSAIEPIMIVFLAVIVGGIVIALFLPMVEILKKLG